MSSLTLRMIKITMKRSVDSITLNRLTAIKLLLTEAIRAINAAGVQRAFAILHAHDALDWTFQVAYTHPKIGGNKKAKMFLIDYARKLEKHKSGLVNLGNVSRLNTLRVNFKHDLILPDPELTKELIYWAENQTNTICQYLFQFSLADVDLTIAIENDNVKDKINEADDQFSKGKVVDAFCNLSIAFEIIKHGLQDEVEKATGKKVVFGTDFSFSNSFFLKVEEIGKLGSNFSRGHDFAKAWDQIIDGVEYLIDMSFVNFLGINLSDYFQFQSVTPRPMRMMNGEYRCDVSDRLAVKMKASEYQKCRNFVIEATLKAQSKIL